MAFSWQWSIQLTKVKLIADNAPRLSCRTCCHIPAHVSRQLMPTAVVSSRNCMKTRKKYAPNKKKSANILEVERKDVTLHRNSEINLNIIGIWCNGNTADSGPAFPGSSPGIPTKRNLLYGRFLFFCSGLVVSLCRPLYIADEPKKYLI